MWPQFSYRGTLNPQQDRRRSRKDKMKVVCQMTQEELDAESSSWRRYGQKPIKGLPHPRNYYRCIASKGCAARKLVDRSPTDLAIFMVTYTGQHTHARPAYRGTGTNNPSATPADAINNNHNSNSVTVSAQRASASGAKNNDGNGNRVAVSAQKASATNNRNGNRVAGSAQKASASGAKTNNRNGNRVAVSAQKFSASGAKTNNHNGNRVAVSAQKASTSSRPILPDLNLPPTLSPVKTEDVEEAPTGGDERVGKRIRA